MKTEQEYREEVKSLTLEEKAWLLGQKGGSFGRVEKLGRAGNVPQDNPRNGMDYFRSGMGENDGQYHPVAFPPAASLGLSWDCGLAREVGRMTALEGRANPEKVTWIFRPGVNIKRSPLCGRNFEYISEDPVLAGELAGSYIQGMQEEGVAATLKHYICNNQEFERMTTNSVVDNRTLHEIYLKPFEIAIKKGNPWSVMSSYNMVNGEWVNSNEEVMKMLREELGYEGVVVSDFAAIHHNKVKGHVNGLDIELAPDGIHSQELIDAVRRGELSESALDEALIRVFKLCDKLAETPGCELDMEEMHVKAREAAEQSVVLLKNDGVLPVSPKTRERLLVVGNLAVNPSYMGGGSGHMNGYRIDKPLEEIRAIAGCEVDFAKGYETKGGWPPVDVSNEALIEEAVEKAKESDVVFFFAGLEYCYESEGYDRADILLPESQRMLLGRLLDLECKVILIASCGSVLDLSAYAQKAGAVIYTGLAGEAFGGAIARILFGMAEPGGRLAETFPMCLEHTPAYLNFVPELMDKRDVVYGEGIYVGYRWYDMRKLPVLYPFGYGLSYTTFELSEPKLDKSRMTPRDSLTVSVKVKNTGKRAGSQVIQVYVRDVEAVVRRPKKELKAFTKVWLEPGEEREVGLKLKEDAFAFYSPQQRKWIVESGTFEIMVGTSVADIVFTETVEMTDGMKGIVYTEMTPLVWFMKNPKFMEIVRTEFPKETYDMLRQETFEWACLIMPLPFYKMTEPYLGQSLFTKDEVAYLLRRMNE